MKVKSTMILLFSILLIGVLSGCATISSNSDLGSYAKRPGDKFHCPVHNLYYGDKERDKHGGDICKRRVVGYIPTTPSYTTTGERLQPMSSSNIANIQKDGTCESNFVLLNAPVQVNISRAPYWPSRRRLIYFNNVYSGRQIRYLGGNWGWRGSRSRRSSRSWSTGYYGYGR